MGHIGRLYFLPDGDTTNLHNAFAGKEHHCRVTNRLRTTFTCTNPNTIGQIHHENLAIANMFRTSGLDDRVNRASRIVVVEQSLIVLFSAASPLI